MKRKVIGLKRQKKISGKVEKRIKILRNAIKTQRRRIIKIDSKKGLSKQTPKWPLNREIEPQCDEVNVM